jgi:hypothetical protein
MLEVWDQPALFLQRTVRIFPMPFPKFWCLAGNLWWPLASVTLILPLCKTLCKCLCPNFTFLKNKSNIGLRAHSTPVWPYLHWLHQWWPHFFVFSFLHRSPSLIWNLSITIILFWIFPFLCSCCHCKPITTS